MLPLRTWLADKLRPAAPGRQAAVVRARPGQALDQAAYLYAFGPDASRQVAQFALSPWVGTAVSRMSSAAVAAKLRVYERRDEAVEIDDHPLLSLIGPYGKPNDAQDVVEFLEQHLQSFDLAGNVFWYWFSGSGDGVPTEVFQLEPTQVRVVPGSNRTVAQYVYRHLGRDYPLDPAEVSHFRRGNPFSLYYGMSALDALMTDILADRSMSQWNLDFFGEGVSLPVGIMVVPDSTSDAELARLQAEFEVKYGQQRRTAIVKSPPGAASWFDAGAKHHDLDFGDGRLLARSVVFDALDLPRGLLSEASTEAHARVAERQFYAAVQNRLSRIAAKLNSDGMGFWPRGQQLACRFLDLRQQHADWQQELYKVQALTQIASINEIRADYNMPAVDWGEREKQIARNGQIPGPGVFARDTGNDGSTDGLADLDQQQSSA